MKTIIQADNNWGDVEVTISNEDLDNSNFVDITFEEKEYEEGKSENTKRNAGTVTISLDELQSTLMGFEEERRRANLRDALNYITK